LAIEPTGQIGGNEYAAAGRIEIVSQRLRREDRYRWWRLTADTYFVECNESVGLTEGAETESLASKSTAQKQKIPKRKKIPVLKA